jgi:hypothetical protein
VNLAVESCRRMGIPVRQYLLSVLPGMADRKVSEVDPVGLVAAAKGLAECMDIRKAGGWPNDYGTSAAPHKGVFGAIPSALLCTLARPHGRPPGPRP